MGTILPTGPIHPYERSAHHISFCVRNVHRREVLKALEVEGILASGGSACHATSDLPSHVLVAMQVPAPFLHGSIRITLSHCTTEKDVRSIL